MEKHNSLSMTHRQFRIRRVVLQWSYHPAGKLHRDFRGMVRDGKCSGITTIFSFLLHNLFSADSLTSLCCLQKISAPECTMQAVLQRMTTRHGVPHQAPLKEWVEELKEKLLQTVEGLKGLKAFNSGSSNFALQGKYLSPLSTGRSIWIVDRGKIIFCIYEMMTA